MSETPYHRRHGRRTSRGSRADRPRRPRRRHIPCVRTEPELALSTLPPTPDLWKLLHDGYIDDVAQPASDVLRLRVRCLYLAERFDPPGDAFRIELRGVTVATYQPYDGTVMQLGQAHAKAGVDFATAEVEGDHIAVWGSVGCLRLAYRSAVLARDDGSEFTLEALRAKAAEYWAEFAARAR